MSNRIEQVSRSGGFEWIRSPESGSTFICPTGTIRDKSRATESELETLCVDESSNPQNN